MKKIFLFLLCLTIGELHAQHNNNPKWFYDIFRQHEFTQKFLLKKNLKPNYLEADFNGDGMADLIALVKERKTSKVGIMLIDRRTKKYTLINISNSAFADNDRSDNVSWITGWQVYTRKTAYETTFNDSGDIIGTIKRPVKNNALYIWAKEDGYIISGKIIVWDGKKFRWIHQGE